MSEEKEEPFPETMNAVQDYVFNGYLSNKSLMISTCDSINLPIFKGIDKPGTTFITTIETMAVETFRGEGRKDIPYVYPTWEIALKMHKLIVAKDPTANDVYRRLIDDHAAKTKQAIPKEEKLNLLIEQKKNNRGKE